MSGPARAGSCALAALAAWALLLAGCARREAFPPNAPEARLGPEVEQVFPVARATRILPETEIWARFRAALDPATVTPQNVFLKLDTERVRSAISYDAATRTLRIAPLERLRLVHTYTVELTSRLATASGTTLDSTYFWQFTIGSVRTPGHPVPADGARDQSPYATFGWDSIDAEAGRASYEVFVGTDSAAVASRAVAPLVSALPFCSPAARSASGSTVWWSVRARNLDTGEQAEGPTWHFATAAADAAVDSLDLPISGYISIWINRPTQARCNLGGISIGSSSYKSMIRWNVASAPAGLRLAGAVLRLWATSTVANTRDAAVYGTTTDFDPCQATYSGVPFIDSPAGVLADGTFDSATGRLDFRGDRLSLRLQRAVSFGRAWGYLFGSREVFQVFAPGSAVPPLLRLYYYRDPPTTPAAPADGAAPARPGAPPTSSPDRTGETR